MVDYLIQNLLLLLFNDWIVISGCIFSLLFILYLKYIKKDKIFNNLYDYKTVVVSVLNYTTNERIDNTVVLKKEKSKDTYILLLTNKQGYYISFHVCGENIIIGTNVDKKCKPNNNKINIVLLPNFIKIKIIDPD